MIIVKLKGGLGNQLFQYCFAYYVWMKTGQKVKIDMSSYNSQISDGIHVPRLLKMKISLPVASENDISSACYFKHNMNVCKNIYRGKLLLESIINSDYYLEKNRSYVDVLSMKPYKYYDGYWQSWKYVDSIWDDVKNDFAPNETLNEKILRIIEEVSSTNSVSIGIRRGDYSKYERHYGSFSNDYYQRAMDYIENHLENVVFNVFSDDIDWARNNIDFSKRTVVFREHESTIDDFEDLFVIAACKHSIITNSTFHWWGARLNYKPGKIVVAPSRWFADMKPIDIVPPYWVELERKEKL
jgi:hypothetical protein